MTHAPELPDGRLVVLRTPDPDAVAEAYRDGGAVVVRGLAEAVETARIRRTVIEGQRVVETAAEVRQLLDRLTMPDAALALPASPATLRDLAAAALAARGNAEVLRLEARSGPTYPSHRVDHAVDALSEHAEATAGRQRQVHLARGLVVAAVGVSLMLAASGLIPPALGAVPALLTVTLTWWLTRPSRLRAERSSEEIERLVEEFDAVDADDLADTVAWQDRWRQREVAALGAEAAAEVELAAWRAVAGDRDPTEVDVLLAAVSPHDEALLGAITEVTGGRPPADVLREAEMAGELLAGRHRWLAWRAVVGVVGPVTPGAAGAAADEVATAADASLAELAELAELAADGPLAVLSARPIEVPPGIEVIDATGDGGGAGELAGAPGAHGMADAPASDEGDEAAGTAGSGELS